MVRPLTSLFVDSGRRKWWIAGSAVSLIAAFPSDAKAMHIAEGILPLNWAALWFVVSVPFLAWGLRTLKRCNERNASFKPLVSLVGAAVFIISCMPIPVPNAGTCSHPCGTGVAAILIGPSLAVVVTSVALLLQALFLGHGGLTTLGADILSMGAAGGFAGFAAFHLSRKLKASWALSAFFAGLISDWATYAFTSLELAGALHGDGSFYQMFLAICLAFCPTQIPLGILEGFIAAGAFAFIQTRRPDYIRLFQDSGKRL